ncbi:KAR9-domain-containing protein [Myriangium duriaei CBS 260.36]|uniref:KAR9-domain-containing protein n=1 Tax=Myriangium duriaei CBS 260.36 TaxID=1168546 RepID=A0A9P4J0X7_9PEZI|nr:KAR9-domain-containing protein [Myriangium duriaei CBS 260.36]
MAAPSYAQAILDPQVRSPHSRQYGLGIDSDGYQSSVPDISTIATYSDTDESESPAAATADRRKRGFVTSLKTKLHTRPGNAYTYSSASAPRNAANGSFDDLSPVPSSPSRNSVNGNSGSDADNPGSGLSRAGSVYSLSRISFASRLAQLTSIPLPTASSLSARISSQPTAHLAARSLAEAGEQIKLWTRKASDVLQDLDAQDDVEWSSAGGSEGLDDVDQAITRFEGLVKVYVICIEELQMRSDVRTLSDETLKTHVSQMEGVVMEWSQIKKSLKAVKDQVEIALEWEELWNTVLGEIAQELGALSDLIFEMEEKRHQTVASTTTPIKGRNVDIDELADIMEGKASAQHTPMKSKLTLPPPFSPSSPIEAPSTLGNKDDSKLLGLFARMQPLRASLDFLPMRLSAFHTRGNALFPSGCIELESRRDTLEGQWKKLEADAEALRKELGEDRWLLVFRNAGSQALKMFESVERSQLKLTHALSTGQHQTDPAVFARMIENFEAKKTHYVPAIDRVLALIDRGVLDRLSVNGEILRLQSDMKRRYTTLQANIKTLDNTLDHGGHEMSGQQLRDSISSILSSERSHASSALDTPHSSPASSIVMRSRNSSVNSRSTPTVPSSSKFGGTRRMSNLAPATPSTRSRLSEVHRAVTAPITHVNEPYTGKKTELFRDFKQPSNKPRWSSSGSTTVQRDFPPLSATEPSPYSAVTASPRKYTPSRISQLPAPLTVSRRAPSPSPDLLSTPTSVRRTSSAQQLPPRPSSALDYRSLSSSSTLSPYKTRTASSSQLRLPSTPSTARRPSIATLPTLVDEDDTPSTPSMLPRPTGRPSLSRPPSAMSNATYGSRTSNVGPHSTVANGSAATQRRTSLASVSQAPVTPGGRRTSSLLAPQGVWSRGGGRDSRTGMRSVSAMGMTSEARTAEKPRWKF